MLSKWDELRLIARCVAGDDRHAFERLVDEYNDGLRRFLLNLTLGDACLTDDLAQGTFYLSLRSFQGLARFKTWLYRIAYNEYYSYMRKLKEEYPESEIRHDIMDSSIEHNDAKIDVERCLKVLNETERSIVLLFYMEDRPIKQISEITGLPPGTIK